MKTTRFAAWTSAVTAGLALAGVQPTVYADHIFGHDDCDTTFPMPIPGQEHFTGGVMWVSLIGPIDESIVTGTTFDITYVSDGATPASELLMILSLMVDEDFPHIHVSGADLGFGDGPGTFKGTFYTEALNGVAWESFLVAPYSLADLQIDSVNGGGIQGTGYFLDSFITCDVIPQPGCAPACPSDLTGDGAVGSGDLIALLGNWGSCKNCDDCAADLDDDCTVGAQDLITLLGAWGPCE